MIRYAALLLCFALLTGCGVNGRTLSSLLLPVPVEEVIPEPFPTPTPEPTPPPPTVATLAVCGDAMAHSYISNDAWDEERGVYDYTHIMTQAKPYVEGADYAVVNLETPLTDGKPTGYPRFSAADSMAYNLKELGFDLCLTANNHALDKGYSGLVRTLDVLDEAGLAHVGTSRSPEEGEANAVLADVGGISVAFVGYTYGTNGLPIPEAHPECINVYNRDYLTHLADPDYDKLLAGLEQARALEPDLIAVMIHWGVEYKTQQNHFQEEVADFLFANGADLVLGGHSHVLQPMEIRRVTTPDGTEKQGFLSYSLGNFFSAQIDKYTDTTVVLTLELTRDNETGITQVTGYSYVPMFMSRQGEKRRPRFELIDAHAMLSAGVEDEELRGRLEEAIQTCHSILGEEFDGSKP